MPLPIPKNQFRKLGDRLRHTEFLAEADSQLLERVRQAYQDALDETASRLSELGVGDLFQRVKTTRTLVEKLRREHGIAIDKIRDIAGARIAVKDRWRQERVQDEITEIFADGSTAPKVINRAQEPNHGYRAVHVLVYVKELPRGNPGENLAPACLG